MASRIGIEVGQLVSPDGGEHRYRGVELKQPTDLRVSRLDRVVEREPGQPVGFDG